MNNSVFPAFWDRCCNARISRNQFMLFYGALTLLGVLVTALVSYHAEWIRIVEENFEYVGPGSLSGLLFGAAVISIVTANIALRSDSLAISLSAYIALSGSLGLVVGSIIQVYEIALVVKVFLGTCVLAGLLSSIRTIISDWIEALQGWYIVFLYIVLVWQFVLAWEFRHETFLRSLSSIWIMLGVIVSSCLIVYHVNRAWWFHGRLNKAVNCATALYLYFIYLFIIILLCAGKVKNGI